MGINFVGGHPALIFGEEEGEELVQILRRHAGSDVPVEEVEGVFVIQDEMGWSWWNDLRRLAIQRLGKAAVPHMLAVDAWNGVYVDADIERLVIGHDGERIASDAEANTDVETTGDALQERILADLGLSPEDVGPEVMQAIMSEMVGHLGAREGEEEALQIASLRGLMRELELLLGELGIEADVRAVDALREEITADDERCDEETAIQCLCHAYVTGHLALENGVPMWLCK